MNELERDLRGAAGRLGTDRTAMAAQRLAREAAEAGLVEVAYTTIDSPLGPLLAAVTERGLLRLAYDGARREDELLGKLAEQVSPRILELPARLDEARRELDEYFAGRRHEFELPLDWRFARGFGREVLRATAAIPFGEVATYRDVATSAGSPRAVRAAGNALGANAIPIVVPCHRVVRTGGGLGGYTGGLERKELLLALERGERLS